MWEKLKRKIVHKLGGIFVEDLPINIRQQILNHWCNKTIDIKAARLFHSGF